MRKAVDISLLIVIFTLASFAYLPRKEKYVFEARKNLPKVVSLTTTWKKDGCNVKIHSAGVFVTSQGHILTCAHAFQFANCKLPVTVETYWGEIGAAQVIKVHKKSDLALLYAPIFKNSPYVRLQNPKETERGQEVIIIGPPYKYQFSISNGLISGLNRDFKFAYNMVQTNAVVTTGNSGGPIFNLNGELVGIVSFLHTAVPGLVIPTGFSFAVSPGQCLEFLTDCSKIREELKDIKWMR